MTVLCLLSLDFLYVVAVGGHSIVFCFGFC